MTHTEHNANTASSPKTGLLRAFLHPLGSGASTSGPLAVPGAVLATLTLILAALAFAASPALALEKHVYISSFGAGGSEPGKFSEPSGVAVNSSTSLTDPAAGDVYVVDKGNNRVERFSSTGAYIGQFNGSGTHEVEPGKVVAGTAAPTGAFSSPEAIAVDSSTNPLDPSTGDVYVTDTGHDVIDKFNAEGTYLGQITTGSRGVAFSGLAGVAVDTKGTVWVYEGIREIEDAEVDGYNDALTNELNVVFVEDGSFTYIHRVEPGLAVDSKDEVYVVNTGQGGSRVITPLTNHYHYNSEGTTGITINPSDNGIYLDNGASIREFPTKGSESETVEQSSPVDTFGQGNLTQGQGIAVSSSTGTVYVADAAGNDVAIFDEVLVPDVLTGEATKLRTGLASESAATVSGTVDPAGVPITSCKFEYGTDTSYGHSEPCEQTLAEINANSAKDTETVTAKLSGLTPGTVYHYRLVASNANGKSEGADREFTANTHSPEATTGEADNLQSEGSATLHGAVSPEDLALMSCEFEYTSEYEPRESNPYLFGAKAPCEQGLGDAPGEIGEGTKPVPVSANLTGLITPGTLYHYRLVASNANGAGTGKDSVFTATAHPTITGESFSGLGSNVATLSAQINPGGLSTTYRVEYGTTTSYGSTTSEASAGAGLQAAGVQVKLAGLQPGTVYHARLVAVNERGSQPGSDVSFTTTAAAGATTPTLPDQRAYELVSPVTTEFGEAYTVGIGGGGGSIFKHEISATGKIAVRAAANGDGVAYIGEALAGGGNGRTGEGGGNTWLATRTADGWTANDISPADNFSIFSSFSSDLSLSILHSIGTSEGLGATLPAECRSQLYTFSNGVYAPTIGAPASLAGCDNPEVESYGNKAPYDDRFAGESENGSHLLIQSSRSLTVNAPHLTQAEKEGEKEHGGDLYDFYLGTPMLVNVLPDGEPVADAVFGAPQVQGLEPWAFENLTHAISVDGSRIFWTVLNVDGTGTNDLFVRENDTQPQSPLGGAGGEECLVSTDACTVQVDVSVGGGGEYRTASSDGSKVFFTKNGDLYVFDINSGQTTDLAPSGEVQGVAGSSEDGSYIYFVAKAVLSAGENARHEKAIAGEDNLYLIHYDGTHWETPKYIANASSGTGYEGPEIGYNYGDWEAPLGLRTATATPDGRHLVYMDSSKVYLYDEETDSISCVSCGSQSGPSQIPFNQSNIYMLRSLSENGDRLFFDSKAALVPRDTNGVYDVYEWERAGAGTCEASSVSFYASAGGCLYLISGDTSADDSLMIDASASGGDVFFTTRAQLVPSDHSGSLKVYDARVDGGFPEPALQCTGTGCQGVPSAPPIFATPSSVTFNGIGNFPVSLSSKKAATKKTAKCRKGFVKKKSKCMRKLKSKKKIKGSARTNRRASR